MKYKCLLGIMTLFGCIGCENPVPNKIATVKVIYIGGNTDTLTIEYYQGLHIWEYNLNDRNADTKAKGVVAFSIIGDIKQIK